tara:strand:- start:1441 stop:1641 length:201 start_codon:yes stop_codon:yes gene_type:complete
MFIALFLIFKIDISPEGLKTREKERGTSDRRMFLEKPRKSYGLARATRMKPSVFLGFSKVMWQDEA